MLVDVFERQRYLDELGEQLAKGKISIGEAVYRLRKDVTGLGQAPFARMCKISLRALRQIEHNEGNPTLQTLNNIFNLFGLQMGVIKRAQPD